MRTEPRILIVDDDGAIRALLLTVLHRRGLPADTARNGREAVEKLATCSYALILLDLMMPEMDGYELLEHLRACPPGSRPIVIVLTAGGEPPPMDESLVVGTLHKPFDVEMLVDTIIACISALDVPQQPGATDASVSPGTPN